MIKATPCVINTNTNGSETTEFVSTEKSNKWHKTINYI